MRPLLLVTLAAALGSGCRGGRADPKPAPAPPVPIENAIRACADAAAGLERATRGIRAPEESVLSSMQRRCADDGWSALAIECFAAMEPDDLGRCAAKLPATSREAVLAVIGGTETDRTSVAILVARLSALKVGVGACDRFVAAVGTMMSGDRMPLDARVQLGSETADFWSLPTSGLSTEAQARMAAACGESLQALQQQAVDVGCMP